MMRALPAGKTLLGSVAGLAALMTVTGCGPLISFGDNGPADQIYTLAQPGGMIADETEGPLIYFDDPHLAEGLGGQRIAVRLGATKRSTLSGARWVTGLSTLVRDYLTRSLSGAAHTRAIGEGGLDVKVDCRLGMKIWSFDYVPGQTGGDDTVDVAIELSLIRLRDGHLVGQQMFRQSPAVAGTGSDAVSDAFNAAMTADSDAMAKWLAALKDQCSADAS